jgi:flagellar basal-body rod modification protein FlgD
MEGQQPISSTMYLLNHKRDERKTGDGVLGKDDFMKLLIAQLQNQDPTNPMKDNEFIAQMAQFSALEQTMNLSKAFEQFAVAQSQSQLIQYNSFIGKNVKWHEMTENIDEDGKPIVNEGTGLITSAKYINGSIVFSLQNGKELTPGNISEVLSSGTSSNRLVEASLLIGKKVTFVVDEEEFESVVQSVSNKDGKLHYLLEDGSKIEEHQLTSISQ